MKIKNIEKGLLYEYSQLQKDGYRFARIKVNREIDSKHVTKKKDSMDAMGGAIMPFLVTPASSALKQGLKVILDDDTEVTDETKDIDKILVFLDGQHRASALKRLYSEGKTSISAYIMLPLVETDDIVKLLQEVNTSVNPWDGIDWLTSLNVTAQGLDISVDAIEFVRKLSTKPNISDSAAWLWAKGEIISKAKIVRNIKAKDSEQIAKISDDMFLEKRQELYKETETVLGPTLVGLKKIPQLLNDFELDLVNNGISSPQTWDNVITFISTLDKAVINNLKDAKKTESQTKDQILSKYLKSAWKQYKFSLGLPSVK